MRRQRGFTLIELMVSSAVTFITVLAVSAAFLGYTQSFYTQAGIRGGQASLRQTHLMVVRNLRMAGYGIEPSLAFGFPADWSRESPTAINRSDRLVFRMRNPAFNARVESVAEDSVTLVDGLTERLRRGQIVQLMCPGAISWTYARLREDAPKGAKSLSLQPKTGTFPNLNEVHNCFSNSGALAVYVFKIDVYDYSIQLIDEDGDPASPGRPYLFRRHGLGDGPEDSFGEPVAEDIEALRVTFVKADGSTFIPDPNEAAPDYGMDVGDPRLTNNHPGNIRAVVVGLVARSTTRDSGAGPEVMNQIPAFGRKADGTPEEALSVDPTTGKPVPYGFRRIVSEMSVQVRNMLSTEMPVPLYYEPDGVTPDACRGELPGEANSFNCAGG
ncbi:prepilin-type N-terminal cleavage/methylation domain-containing protein [Archangium violaceum]|uniref:prepilin-type N-terminal cleavage/methylation domain-containing protein n=1 Tax=Archangium violaceum TaxID=83451 RepID=UPI00193C0AF3|nr:prepilin-type N-terminal cleavage/methylation domain-containing protein [Archangium violaceum]QRK12884.1 prepilin-type N-terminal cleavage/methylation domain-containing protein [Archangium violaceum]